MLTVIGKVAALFAMIAVGFAASRTSLLTKESIPHLNNLLLFIATPCMIMNALYTRELSPGMVRDSLLTAGAAVFYFAFMTGLTYLFIRLIHPEPKADWGMYICVIVATNTGFMGFPVTLALFGNGILYFVVLHNLLLNVYCYMFEPTILNIGSSSRTDLKTALRSFVNVISVCMVIGLVLMATGTKPPAILDEVITSISQINVPVSMILVGLQLSLTDLKKVFTRVNILCSLFSMIVIPVIYFLIINPLPFLSGEVKTALIFCAVMPAAVATVAISQRYGKNSVTASEIVSITTLISMITIPISAMILTRLYL